MKKTIVMLLCLVMTASFFPLSAFANDGEDVFTKEQKDYYASLGLQGTTVNVYNWGEYISDGLEGSMDVVGEFERLTGAKVNYTNFESNENMYSKLVGGGVSYDVIVPSDYMIERLIDEGMLLELDWSNIPNLSLIDKQFQNLFYDPEQKYSLCYNVGTTALIYNTTLVSEAPDSWEVLWDEQYKGKVLMFNNSRDAFAIAQAVLGQDFNTSNESDWQEAAELLSQQRDLVSPVYVMDEVFNLMESGEYAFATYYAGDYVLMSENNPDLAYAFPKEGVNIFYDAFCIPTCCQNKKGAEAFINFMHEPQVAPHGVQAQRDERPEGCGDPRPVFGHEQVEQHDGRRRGEHHDEARSDHPHPAPEPSCVEFPERHGYLTTSMRSSRSSRSILSMMVFTRVSISEPSE